MEDFEKIELNESEAVEEATDAAEESTESVIPEDTDLNTDNESDISEETVPEAPKKGKIQKPILIAACVLVVAIIAAAAYFIFFNNSVVGTWIMDEPTSSADEASSSAAEENERYYTFENDGTASIKLGTIEIFGTWSYSDDSSSTADEGTKKIDIEILPIIKGTFDYKLDGNGISGRKLTLSSSSASLTFKSTAKAEPDLTVSKKFKADKTVTGKWKNKDYNLIYSFNADGTCDLNNNDRITTTGTYTVDSSKKQITVVYVGEKKAKMYIPYTKGEKKNQLVLSGYTFTKVTE